MLVPHHLHLPLPPNIYPALSLFKLSFVQLPLEHIYPLQLSPSLSIHWFLPSSIISCHFNKSLMVFAFFPLFWAFMIFKQASKLIIIVNHVIYPSSIYRLPLFHSSLLLMSSFWATLLIWAIKTYVLVCSWLGKISFSPLPIDLLPPSLPAAAFCHSWPIYFQFECSDSEPLHVALMAVLSWKSRKPLEFLSNLCIVSFSSLYILYALMYLVCPMNTNAFLLVLCIVIKNKEDLYKRKRSINFAWNVQLSDHIE